jgi:hypothetical protein
MAEEDKEDGDDEEFNIPIFPFIQLNVGLKLEILDQVHLLTDFGIWNGFAFRGGLAFRF